MFFWEDGIEGSPNQLFTKDSSMQISISKAVAAVSPSARWPARRPTLSPLPSRPDRPAAAISCCLYLTPPTVVLRPRSRRATRLHRGRQQKRCHLGGREHNGTGSFNTPTSIAGTDSVLQAFLASHISDLGNFHYTILAADNTGGNGVALGDQRACLPRHMICRAALPSKARRPSPIAT